jgi:hypothetical protein
VTVAIGANPGSGTLGGTLTVAAVNGVATFSNLSINKVGAGYTLAASSTGLAGATSNIFNITVALPAKLQLLQQPGNTAAGASITPAVTVQILDSLGNLTTSTANVTLAIGSNPGSGTLGGTLTVAAVNGAATFSNLSINKVGTGYTLSASGTGLTGVTSSAFNITVGAPTKLQFSQQPGNTVAGVVIAPAVTVKIVDASGNPTSSTANVSIAIGANPGSGTLGGTLTVAAVNGTATFGNLTIDKAGTGYTLAASSTGLTSATSNAFNISAGAPAKLQFQQQPSNAMGGAVISPAVTVRILDANNNPTASTANVSIAIGANPGSGTLGGTLTVAAVSGTATFGSLSIDKAGAGYTLVASSAGLTAATSNAFDITPKTTYTGPTATGSGTASASVSGGGVSCGFTKSVFIPVSGGAGSPSVAPPTGYTFPHGLFDFIVSNCTPGTTVNLAVTYPQALPAGTVYWKFGPTPTPSLDPVRDPNAGPTPHWYQIPATITGNVATFQIVDGGLGDDDVTANGTIVDQGGPGFPGAGTAAIPTLGQWGLMLLAGLLGILAMGAIRGRSIPRLEG